MAPIITDPKKLSMPQQVQKNKDDIAEIKKVIDGLDSIDNVVVVPDISHIMTAEELKSVRQPVCFIVYDNHIYIKKKEESGNAYFQVVFAIVVSTVITFEGSEIEVNLSNGALGIVNTTVSTYSVSQIDTLLGAKANLTYVDTELAKKANLAGADFTGAVTAPTLKQSQYNYSRSFDLTTVGSLTITNVYNRFAEINNLLHLIVNIKITNNSGSSVTLGSGYGFIATVVLSLDHNIAGKIIDMDGNSAADAGTNSTLIASEPCQVLKSKTLGDNTPFYTGRLSLVNRSAVDSVSVQIALNGNTADRITIADGETIYVTARMSLTLI